MPSSRRDKFPGLPGEELPLDLPAPERKPYDPEQYRAFGSVPRMLGSQIDVLDERRIDPLALRRVTPEVMGQGLFGVEGGTAVNGLALGSEFYEAIIRNHDSFLSSIHAKTSSANRLGTDPRVQEKLYRSQIASLSSKHDRHDRVIEGLEARKEVLGTLREMQRTPGYHRRIEDADIRMMATTVWTEVFGGMINALKDQHGLSSDEVIQMQQALAFRLLSGPQSDRIGNWGGMLQLGSQYTGAVTSMFRQSRNQIEKNQTRLEQGLDEFYRENNISPLGAHAVQGTVDI